MQKDVFGARNHDAASEETVAIIFTRSELWAMHGAIRHEIARLEDWKWPPASKSLNDKIAEALLFVEELDGTAAANEAALLLSLGDCYVIDHQIPDSLKDVDGLCVGININLKQFACRRALNEGEADLRPESDYTYAQARAKRQEES